MQLSKTGPCDLFLPVRPHILKFPEPPKIVPLAGNEAFNKRAFAGEALCIETITMLHIHLPINVFENHMY
jgi:hypothetical protein